MNRFVHVTYCEDVRVEGNGKQIYIGVFTSNMLVKEFPFSMPRLVLLVTAATPKAHPFGAVAIKVMLDDEELNRLDIPAHVLEESQQQAEVELNNQGYSDVDSDSKIYSLNLKAALDGVTFEKPCLVRVWVEVDGEVLKAPALRVMQAPNSQPN